MKYLPVLLCLLASAPLLAAPCASNTPVGSYCEIDFNALHPTQPAIGLMQVEDEVKAYAGQSRKQYIKLMRKKEIPVVIGPDGGFYLTDRHHLSSALWRLKVPQATVKVIGKLDDASNFWPQMQARHWAWLYDQHGAPLPPTQLPRNLASLKDDPYRALAGYAQGAHYYNKAERAYFVEFAWARYFGEQMQWRVLDRSNLPAALKDAQRLACLPAAQPLPGYKDDCKVD
ncbi:hypothetical protein IGB42_01208 [Andreprevotia sp. IGB-42]|uniref:ParB-like protein n=1 Tax=Andreprevotia sp. IGB-42 TaxID=2497473 RepID=UPI001357726A|nr:ParB-like protein [Andreprevotia sp. IGB-42]KAF0814307.1 hypothetical protein IGB42_01208 [Andreprevotia sp. IGB-42]